jgi:myo-inositol 2-dehydrogenase/D-chiro-inositol 1-dehydrogenase
MTVRVGFLGGGLIATYHRTMLEVSGADAGIVAVHDPDPARADTFAAASGAAVAATEGEVFDRVDAVYVCTWTSEHPRLVAEAARRGLAVFCEKPLAVDLPTAVGMVETVQAAGVVNQVGLVLRDSPAFLFLRWLIERPETGRVMNVVFRDDQYIPVQGMYASTWRGDRTRCGAGTLLEHSIHDLDLLEWMLGPSERVSALTANHHGLDGIEDAVVASLGFEGGALASLTSVWHDVLARPSQRRVEVFGERAHLVLEGDVFGPVRWERDDDRGVVEGEALMAELDAHGVATRHPDRAFIEAVQAGAPASPDMAEAIRAHLLVDAVYRSAAASGAAVEIPAGPPGPSRPQRHGGGAG